MSKKITDLKEFEDRHHKKFPNQQIKVLYRIDEYIYFETEFGLCRKRLGSFGRNPYNIQSAVNKSDFLIKKLISIYKEKYDYSSVEFKKDTHDKILLKCKIHDNFFLMPISKALRKKARCPICSRKETDLLLTSNNDKFIKKANTIHNYKYDYSLVDYVHSEKEIIIICNIHGKFSQTPVNHFKSSGCKKCGFQRSKEENSKNPTGWSLTDWIKSAKRSKYFDSFKVYIIECWNENEHFYKIGRTFNTVTKRFTGQRNMPYNYKIIRLYEETAEEIIKLETKLKSMNKQNKYVPEISFNGFQECYKQLENYEIVPT